MKQSLKTIYTIILAALLAACETAIPVPIIATTATPMPSLVQVSPTPSVFPTPSPMPVTATPTIPVATLTAVPISSLPLSSAPEGLRMAYVVDGNLYFQSASNAPVQLTHTQGDLNPRFSEDGERILFYRNPEPFAYHILDLYSIHTDGTQEKQLVTGNLLKPLGYNGFIEIMSSAYVPGTHQVLFNTRQLSTKLPGELSSEGSKLSLDLLSVDIDTGEIEIVLPPGKGGNFVVSPDGSMVAIQASGHIDVIGIDGRMIRQNLVTYTPSQPYELIPDMFWTEDSTELIVALPVDAVYELKAECDRDLGTRSLQRYVIEDDTQIPIPLHPLPVGNAGDEYRISPDGNWILYFYFLSSDFYCPGKMNKTVASGYYLGNLRESTAQVYSPYNTDPIWSPDSMHFLYDTWQEGMFLGSVDELPVLIDPRTGSLGWLDSAHYLAYYAVDESAVGVVGEINGEIIYFPIGVPVSVLEDTARELKLDFIYLNH